MQRFHKAQSLVLKGFGHIKAPFGFRMALGAALADEIDYGRHQLWSGFFILLGVALYFALPVNPSPAALYGTTGMTALFVFSLRKHFPAFAGAVCFLAILAGCLAADGQVRRVSAPRILESTGPVKVSGTVLMSEKRAAQRPRIVLDVTRVDGMAATSQPRQVRLTGVKLGDLVIGDHVEVEARLRPMPPPTNPGAYDPSYFAFFDQIGGIGTASNAPVKIERPEKSFSQKLVLTIAKIRTEATKRIREGLQNETGAIAASLVTGDRAGITEELYQSFNGSGLIHVLSISGLHMVLVAGGMFFAARLLFSFLSLVTFDLPSKKLAAIAALMVVTVYEILSGGEVATTRSYIMIVIVFGALLLDRPALSMRNVVIAAVLIALVTPSEILSPSFQMSFAATAALIAAHERRLFPRLQAWDDGWLAKALSFLVTLFLVTLCTSLVAELATIPFTLHHFHRISLFGVIGNLLALIFIELAIMPGVLLTLLALPFGLEQLTLPILSFGIDGMVGVARLVSSFPSALIGVPGFGILSLLLCSLGITWASLWRSRLAVFALIPYVAGIAIGVFEKTPDIYISQSGWSVAVRGPDEKLSLLFSPREKFAATRWLETDGDRRGLDETSIKAHQNCDALGCTVINPQAGLIAVSYDRASLPEDCARADVLILPRSSAPANCARPKLVIDKDMIRNGMGISAKFFKGQEFTVRSYAQDCGSRPWCLTPEKFKDQ
jgi:competence protein ComEC